MLYYSYDGEVGQKIKLLRERKSWTQDQLAAKLQLIEVNLTRSAIAKIEVGQRHITLHELKSFREVFGCSYDDLFV